MTTERTPQDVLREAAEQALDRMTTAFDLLGPDMTADDKEKLAQTLWFGKEELDKAIAEAPDSRPAEVSVAANAAGFIQGYKDASEYVVGALDTLSEKPGLDVPLTYENVTRRERLAYDRGLAHKSLDGSHIREGEDK